MNFPTLIGALVVAAVFVAIVAREIYNKKQGKSSCSCGGDCSRCGACHSHKE